MKMTMLWAALRTRSVTVFAAVLTVIMTGGLAPWASADSYDKTRAVNYARAYALWYNYPMFPSFPQDCTNYVSQALAVGGWTYRYNRNETQQWWYGGRKDIFWSYSQSWSVAHTLYNFTLNANRGYVIGQGVKSNRGSYMSLEPGDLIFCDWYKTVNGKQQEGEDGWIDHVYIVTKKDQGNIYVSAHSNDRLDLRFTAIFDDPKNYGTVGATGRFYYMSMRTQY